MAVMCSVTNRLHNRLTYTAIKKKVILFLQSSSIMAIGDYVRVRLCSTMLLLLSRHLLSVMYVSVRSRLNTEPV